MEQDRHESYERVTIFISVRNRYFSIEESSQFISVAKVILPNCKIWVIGDRERRPHFFTFIKIKI